MNIFLFHHLWYVVRSVAQMFINMIVLKPTKNQNQCKSTINYSWFWLTGAMVNQTLSRYLHYGLGCKNIGHGPNLPKGQSTRQCFCHFHESVNDIRFILINRTSCDVNPPIFGHVWQNLNTKLIGSYKIKNSSKFTFLSSWQP